MINPGTLVSEDFVEQSMKRLPSYSSAREYIEWRIKEERELDLFDEDRLKDAIYKGVDNRFEYSWTILGDFKQGIEGLLFDSVSSMAVFPKETRADRDETRITIYLGKVGFSNSRLKQLSNILNPFRSETFVCLESYFLEEELFDLPKNRPAQELVSKIDDYLNKYAAIYFRVHTSPKYKEDFIQEKKGDNVERFHIRKSS